MNSFLARTVAGLNAGGLSSLFLALLLGVVTAANPAFGQTKRAGDTGYFKFGGGLSHYGSPLSDAISFAYVGEVGYQTSPNFGIGLAYQAGRYPLLGTSDNDRFTTQLLGRYTLGAKTWTIAPYVDVGGSLSFTGTDLGGGPTVGAGFDIVLSDFASFYVESRTNLTLPETAMDGVDSVPPFDELSYVGAGFKLNFRAASTAPTVIALDGPTEVQTGESALFTATINDGEATRPLTYRWDFGDGASASGLTATHAFAQAGTYSVSFTARNEVGEASGGLTVTAVRPPQPASIASIGAAPNPVDEGEPVQFSSNVQGDTPLSYNWSFGDEATSSEAAPTHTYEEPGEYTVRLQASNEAGEDARTLTVRVTRALPDICTTISEYNSAFFEQNSSTLTAEARTRLSENADVLSQCPNLQVRIEGFAAPGERTPQALSEDRAEAVADFYRDNDVPEDRMATSGEGPVEGVTTKKGDTRQYRRVDTVPLEGSNASSESKEEGESESSAVSNQSRSNSTGAVSREASNAGRWAVIVASMSRQHGAEVMIQRYRDRLTSDTLSVEIVQAELPQGLRHRVAVGGYDSYDAVKQAIERHGEKLPAGAWPLRLE